MTGLLVSPASSSPYTTFRDVTSSGLVDRYHDFGGICCTSFRIDKYPFCSRRQHIAPKRLLLFTRPDGRTSLLLSSELQVHSLTCLVLVLVTFVFLPTFCRDSMYSTLLSCNTRNVPVKTCHYTSLTNIVSI